MASERNSAFNFEGIKNTTVGSDVRSDEALRSKLIEVGINEGIAYEIDQFYSNELANSKLTPKKMEWIMAYQKIIYGYLAASTTNPNSGRKYNWTILILKAYERSRTLAIVSKAEDGWGFLNILKREVKQTYTEQTDYRQRLETEKKGLFGGKPNQENPEQQFGQFKN